MDDKFNAYKLVTGTFNPAYFRFKTDLSRFFDEKSSFKQVGLKIQRFGGSNNVIKTFEKTNIQRLSDSLDSVRDKYISSMVNSENKEELNQKIRKLLGDCFDSLDNFTQDPELFSYLFESLQKFVKSISEAFSLGKMEKKLRVEFGKKLEEKRTISKLWNKAIRKSKKVREKNYKQEATNFNAQEVVNFKFKKSPMKKITEAINNQFSLFYDLTKTLLILGIILGVFYLVFNMPEGSMDWYEGSSLQKGVNTIYGKPDIDLTSLEAEIHRLTNIERTSKGLSPLLLDSQLSTIARLHSQDMAKNNYFEHDNLKGQDPTDRGLQRGYTCRKDYGSYYTEGIAENIFQNNLYDSKTVTIPIGVTSYEWNTLEELARSTVDGWMNSPGHRKNILTNGYDREGIGIAISSDDKVLITQDFC